MATIEKAKAQTTEGGKMNKAEIKKIILNTMGNPVSGAWAKNADAIAEAIVAAKEPKAEPKTEPEVKTENKTKQKETRVEDATEIR